MKPTKHLPAVVLPAAAWLYGCALLLGCGNASPSPDAAPIDAVAPDAGPSGPPDAAGPLNPCQFLIEDEARPGHPFDVQRFGAEILPDLQGSCGASGCHEGSSSASSYRVWSDSDSTCALIESFNSFYAHSGFAGPVDDSPILRNIDGSAGHPGPSFDPQLVAEIRDFIEDAHVQYTGEAGPGDGCAPAARFDLTAFEDEIMPFFEGRVDYNDPEEGSTVIGCARAECHGSDRGPGTLRIDPSRSATENLDSLRCFVNLQDPSASQALLCPLNLSGCQASPHPGADIFFGQLDLNYQKLLAFILAARNGPALLDFAFFVRKINPMLNDENAVQDGAIGLTCASPGCHAAPSDNGVNFGIVREATAPVDLFLNYVEAVSFVYGPDASLSSLIMYPTNEVANAGNPAATGVDHPGGQCFAVSEPEALDLLTFAGGLRPDAQGFLHHFLIAGLLPATDVTDEPIPSENLIRPRIFDRSGQPLQFNQGQWDMYSSAGESFDFLQAFSVADGEGKLAFAVAYVANTTARDLGVVFTVESENDVMLLVGTGEDSLSTAVGRDGTGVSLTATLPAFQSDRKLTRLMVKAHQKVGDAGLGFSLRFTDEDGNLLTDATRELVFALGSEGGGL